MDRDATEEEVSAIDVTNMPGMRNRVAANGGSNTTFVFQNLAFDRQPSGDRGDNSKHTTNEDGANGRDDKEGNRVRIYGAGYDPHAGPSTPLVMPSQPVVGQPVLPIDGGDVVDVLVQNNGPEAFGGILLNRY